MRWNGDEAYGILVHELIAWEPEDDELVFVVTLLCDLFVELF